MFVPPVTPAVESYAARELGQKITAVIQDYQKSHPGIQRHEIRMAMRIATRQTIPYAARRLILALGVAGAAAMLMSALAIQKHPSAGPFPAEVPMAVIGLLIFVGLIFLIVSRR